MYTLEEIDRIIENAARLQHIRRQPANLYDPLEYMMSIGGKRIRPKLCLLTCNLFQEDFDDSMIFPAMALEVFHEFTLIHDDIMDRSDTRRGQPTVYRKWNEEIAILSGDAMSILAYKYLARAPKSVLPQVLDLFTTTAMQVCEGQQFDMDFEAMPFITMEDYLEMIGLKTAVLLGCSAKLGALIAGAPEDTAQALYDFGYQLGIAFQITDDYLDSFGNEQIFGKKIGGDIAHNKKTWLLVECFHRASATQKKELEKLMLSREDQRAAKIEAVRNLYIECGVKEAAAATIQMYHKKATAALEEAGFNPEHSCHLTRFAEELIHREK